MKYILSEFCSVYNPQATDVYTLDDWPQVVELLAEYATIPYATKDDAPLIQAIEYVTNYRNRENAWTIYAMFLDFDSGYLSASALELCSKHKLEAILYSTGSNMTKGIEKFRVVIPLSKPTKASNMSMIWDSMDACFDGETDESKDTPESHFYVPGIYGKAENFFIHHEGIIHDLDWWVSTFKVTRSRKIRQKRRCKFIDRARRHEIDVKNALTRRTNPEYLDSLPLVEESWEEKYFDTYGENRHAARIGLFNKIKWRAEKKGMYLDEQDLVSIYNELDVSHPEGSRHQSIMKQKGVLSDARKVLSS